MALVTGGGRGIGLGISKALVADSYDIAIVGVRAEDEVTEVLGELERDDTEVLYCRADISSTEDRMSILDAVDRKFGRLDLLVNNAGVAPRVRADILDAQEDSYEWVMKVNLQGPYFLTQAAANWMIRQKQANQSIQKTQNCKRT